MLKTKRLRAPTTIHRAEFGRSAYFHMAEPGVNLADVMSGDYWVHVRKMFRPNDILEVVAADGSFDAELRITSIVPGGAMNFRLLRNVESVAMLQAVPADAGDRYDVKHVGHGSYTVIEKSTGNKVAEGLDKESAHAEKSRLETTRKAA